VALLPNTTLQFYENYRVHFSDYVDAAKQAKAAVAELLKGSVQGVQGVEARAKHPHSLLGKLRQNVYTNPAAELTDLVGVRVITQYPDHAEQAASVIRPEFQIDEEQSSDKLDDLNPETFGYRSIHLVARQHENDAAIRQALGNMWFEVQVRSVLQHAWAEVDHDIKYKSGVNFPRTLRRRLAAIAGGLETLDQAFIDMRGTRDTLIAGYREAYTKGDDMEEVFDSARLVAFLDVRWPEGASLLEAGAVVPGLTGSIEKVINDALETVGVTTGKLLDDALNVPETKRLLKEHASAIGESPQTLSHLIVCLIVVWTQNADTLNKQFPELRFDSDLATTLGFEIGSA
jgi:ppGpp synthetase/RelA/SpoT-type nucleotidyltranferase